MATLLLFVLLAWAPLPYGSNRPWSWSLLAATVGLLLAMAGLARLLGHERTRPVPVVVPVAAATTGAVWLWAWVQTVPLDQLPMLPAWLSAQPFWIDVSKAGLWPATTASVDVEAGRDALTRLLAYGGAFWVAFLLFQEPARGRRLLVLLLFMMSIYAVYGLINRFAGWNTILWDKNINPYSHYITSTFINRNNYATYVNIGILAGVCLLVEPFFRAKGVTDARRIAIEVFENLLSKRGPLLLVVVILAAASLLTGSRGGLLSLSVALAALLVLALAIAKPRVWVMLPGIAVALLAGWAVMTVSGGEVLERFGQRDETGGGRTEFWAHALQMLELRPMIGQGYGGYLDAFNLNRAPFVGDKLVDKAHNTYLEHAVELGIPATVLLYVGPVLLFGYVVRGVLVRRKDHVFPLFAATATVLVAFHSLVDFSLQIPAVALTYAVVLGMGVAQSVPSSSSERRRRHGASLRDEEE